MDAVFHLAALYRDDVRPRDLYYQVNVAGTRNITAAAAQNGVQRIVFTSSFSVYGLDDGARFEDGLLCPSNDYGKSKMAAEEILREWQVASNGRSLQIVRPSVIFGEGNRGNVWTLVNEIAKGRFALVGRGENRKSMAYVGNVVEFLLHLLNGVDRCCAVYNYADKPDLSVREIVDLVARRLDRNVRRIPMPARMALLLGYAGDAVGTVLGRTPVINSERVRKFLADTTLPTERARSSGFTPTYELRAALLRTVEQDFVGVPKSRARHEACRRSEKTRAEVATEVPDES
jgi:nucleoside-diphosphate-sugar epimerase